MRDRLTEAGIRLVAVCNDSVRRNARTHADLGLGFPILSDRDLDLTRRLGLDHVRSLADGGFRPMAMPTTLLVDGDGTIRWLDRSTDYRIRGDERRVIPELLALVGAPGTASAATP